MAGTNKAILMVHDTDPKKVILDKVKGVVDDITVMGAQLLIGVYVRPERSAGGIILAQQTRNEDKWQGKVGLVLKKGPLAFVDDGSHNFGDVVPAVGDWVMINVGDTFAFELGGDEQRARVVEDVNVKAILNKPDIVL